MEATLGGVVMKGRASVSSQQCVRGVPPCRASCAAFTRSALPPRLRAAVNRGLSVEQRRGCVAVRCSAPTLTVKEPVTGVEFPEVANLWGSTDPYRSVGAGVREKKIAFIAVKVYAVTLYVEAEKAARELGVRSRGGFFESDDDFAQALTDGAFNKALQVQLVRDIDGKTFYGALEEALTPRLKLSGDMSSLEKFGAYFQGQNLAKGTDVTLLWRAPDTLEVAVAPAGVNLSGVTPNLTVESASLCRALFEVYLGSSSVVPGARSAWAKGARALLATEEVKRDTRKGGS